MSEIVQYRTVDQVGFNNDARNPQGLTLIQKGATLIQYASVVATALKSISYLANISWTLVSYMEPTVNITIEKAESFTNYFAQTQVGQWFSRNIFSLISEAPSKPEDKKTLKIIREQVIHVIKKQRPPTLKEVSDASVKCFFSNWLKLKRCLGEALQPRVDVTKETYVIEYFEGEEPPILL
jgi:hypothetical protein